MKVILLQDIPHVGKCHDVKDVASGYASNFLIPQNMALPATTNKIKALEERQKRLQAETKVQHELLKKDLEKLSGKTVSIRVRANDQGQLFQGIHEEDILSAIETEIGCRFPEKTLELPVTIKKVGEFPLQVIIGTDKADFTLAVTAV